MVVCAASRVSDCSAWMHEWYGMRDEGAQRYHDPLDTIAQSSLPVKRILFWDLSKPSCHLLRRTSKEEPISHSSLAIDKHLPRYIICYTFSTWPHAINEYLSICIP
jgi:hypothetical protein